MTSFKLICFVIFMLNVLRIHGEISDKRLCADPLCSEAISEAKTLIKYSSPEHGVLSFPANADIIIFSKEAGKNLNLWGAEYNGRRGYVPRLHIREIKIIKKKAELTYLADTDTEIKQVPLNNVIPPTAVEPNKVQEAYEVVDGTTLYTDEPITPSSTQSPIVASAVVDTAVTESPTVPMDILVPTPDVDNANVQNENIEKSIEPEIKVPVETTEESMFGNIVNSLLGNANDGAEDEGVDYEDDEDEEGVVEEEDSDDIINDLDKNIEVEENNSNKNTLNKQELENADTFKKEELLKSDEQYDTNKFDTLNINDKVNMELDMIQINTINDVLMANAADIIQGADNSENKLKSDEIPEINLDTIPLSAVTTEIPNIEIPSPEKVDIETVTADPLTENQYDPYKIIKEQEQVPMQNIDNLQENKDSVGGGFNYLHHNRNVVDQKVKQKIPLVNDEEFKYETSQNIPLNENIPAKENNDNIHANKPELNENINQNVPAISDHIPTIKENVPAINENLPTNNDNVPINTIQPSINENIKTNMETVPTINENIHDTMNDNLPTINENLPTNTEIEQTYNENVPTINENVQIINENLPIIKENLSIINVPTMHENLVNIDQHTKVPYKNNEIIPSIQTDNEHKLINNENVHEIDKNIPDLNETIASNENIPSTENIPINEAIPIIEQIEPLKESHDSIYNYFDKGDKKVEATENIGTVEIINVINKEEPPSTESIEEAELDNSPGFFTRIFNMFSGSSEVDESILIENIEEKPVKFVESEVIYEENNKDVLISKPTQETPQDATCLYDPSQLHCFTEDNPNLAERTEPPTIYQEPRSETTGIKTISMDGGDIINILLVLSVTGVTVVIFLWGNMLIDKNRKEAPLVNKINNLEKSLVVLQKEKQLLFAKISEVENDTSDHVDSISKDTILQLNSELAEAHNTISVLEEQVQSLEKELENSTEVGMELNRMLTDVLSSQNGSDTLMSNVEQLQKQLVEQQSTINTINSSLNEKDLENHELQLEMEINNKKVVDLQSELDKMVNNLLKIEEEKEQLLSKNDLELKDLRNKITDVESRYVSEKSKLMSEVNELTINLKKTQRNYELKSNEYNVLKDNLKDVKGSKDKTETLRSLLDVSSVKAELQQFKRDNQQLTELLTQEQQGKYDIEKQASEALQEMHILRKKYDEADKEKFEALTKLEVLGNYFKEKEAQLQKELSKHENMWIEKQGEATSTTERIRFMQGEMQNFKAQNESLKQEIVSQEVELKSQISLLEKKAHENWVHARQAERKFEDSRQEAAQLRNRLTLRERSFNEDKTHNRILSPLETNGDHHPLSPLHMNDSNTSPLLFGNHDHMQPSPLIPGLPPFLPPPGAMPGFMPPPLPGVPPFMPPPPNMFPGDHRPPPLGRMSSPPINSRYSPDSRPYSPYDRHSPSPTDDDYYEPPHRGYSPYNNGRDDRDRRDYNRPPPPRNNYRNKGGAMSSGSGNSNESLERINRLNSKV